jgi:GAF domain-containing protein
MNNETLRHYLELLFPTNHYGTRVDVYRARVVYAVTGLIVVFYVLYALAVAEWTVPDALRDELTPGSTYTMAEIATQAPLPLTPPTVIFYSLFIVGAVTYIANRRGYTRVAYWAPVLLWYVSGVLLLAQNTDSPGEVSGANALLLVLAGLLVGSRGIGVALVGVLAAMIVRDLEGAYDGSNITVGNMAIQAIAGAILVLLFLRFARHSRYEGAAAAVQERNISADIISNIASKVSDRASLQSVLDAILSGITSGFAPIYHAQIFLITDDGHDARLVASTGEAGRVLLSREHRLIVGSRSVIGQVTLRGSQMIERAGGTGSIHRRNELLPETEVEAAFPLRVGDRIIGALDLQSKSASTFDDSNLMATLQALADSTALAIDNVSQYERAEARLAENAALVEQTRRALAEVERLNQRLTGRAWADYLREAPAGLGLSVDFASGIIKPEEGWTPGLRQAIEANYLVQESEDDRQVIALPLRVRGQVVGALEFELDKDRDFSPEDFDVVQEVSERFGMAAENARLVDQSQRVAQREALVNQISARLQTSSSVEAALAEAARSLRDAFKAQRVAIRLGEPPATESESTTDDTW